MTMEKQCADLSTAILLFEPLNSATEAAFKLVKNRNGPFIEPTSHDTEAPVPELPESRRESTPLFSYPRLPRGVLRLTQPPFDPSKGWVFGSSKDDNCDFQLAEDQRTGVSRLHFRINFDWKSRTLILANLSQHHTVMRYGLPSAPESTLTLTAKMLQNIPLGFCTIGAGTASIRCWTPDRGEFEDQFNQKLFKYCNDIRSAMPRLVLTINDVEPTPLSVTGAQSNKEYVFEDIIGTGGFGIVSKVKDPTTNRLYAAKLFKKGTFEDNRREITLHRQVSHPFVVRVFDVQEIPRPLIIMEYMPLGDLKQQESLTKEEVVIMLKQQCSALIFLHINNIVHRDIKPGNILVESRDPNFVTKLSDFGLSKNVETGNPRTFCGTEGYKPPEIHRSRQPYTSAVDIWSLGIVGLELLHSLPTGDRQVNWAAQIVGYLASMKPLSLNLLQRMLSIEPSNRPSARECLDELLKVDPRPLDMLARVTDYSASSSSSSSGSSIKSNRGLSTNPLLQRLNEARGRLSSPPHQPSRNRTPKRIREVPANDLFGEVQAQDSNISTHKSRYPKRIKAPNAKGKNQKTDDSENGDEEAETIRQ